MLLKNANILIVDDDTDVLTAMRLLLKSKVNSVVTEKNPNHIVSLIQQHKFDIIILDMNFNGLINTGNEGIFWLNKIKSINKEVSVILITAYGDLDLAIKSLKQGASDFLVKPWENNKLIEAIGEVLDKKKSKTSKKQNTLITKTEILGESHVMNDVFFKIKKIAPTDANILILGENGTGKDLIAKAIHDNSLRKNKPFVKVDVGALTATLFESELFGYKKGAFTDAKTDRQGRFEAADGGTLFLDEIGNISLQQQARLLTVIQNRQVTPLGSNKAVPINIRLICATNLDIKLLADEANFRKDLIYRINTVEIVMPPLRDRDKDVVLLAKYFIGLYAEKYLKSSFQLDASFIEKLKNYYFPGNVRELQYAIERAVIMAENTILYDTDLVFSPIEKQGKKIGQNDLKLETIEKNAILKVLEKHGGNVSRSAKELGITRTALYRRLNKYGL
ncbi:sigma-54-dependent transcriptional regulator [Flavivirga algicola]|uniref:Sigma-54-dependent Fis family transcriptional regulator n=1 Tax=Flavivirga algicola TaxID=2729136 RepID=A0ABX1RZB7_9FLAO|nr:sigma-54 dependent transcriptional regulator [Flavivirga algicola]NMH88917.1 sigma-54-dependent Fis family transcriptional regulator [Flavivirga algicola]